MHTHTEINGNALCSTFLFVKFLDLAIPMHNVVEQFRNLRLGLNLHYTGIKYYSIKSSEDKNITFGKILYESM